MSEEEKVSSLITYLYETMNGELALDYATLDSENIEILLDYIQQKENIIKEVREYIKNNWISKKDADNYRFDDEELDIEISDIAVLYDILDKENK